MSKKISNILFGVTFILVASFLFYSEKKNQLGFEMQLNSECQGIIDKIERRGSTIYFIVGGDSLNFGSIGPNLEQNAVAGDSLIKKRGSKIVELLKMKNNKVVSSNSYELYTIGLFSF